MIRESATVHTSLRLLWTAQPSPAAASWGPGESPCGQDYVLGVSEPRFWPWTRRSHPVICYHEARAEYRVQSPWAGWPRDEMPPPAPITLKVVNAMTMGHSVASTRRCSLRAQSFQPTEYFPARSSPEAAPSLPPGGKGGQHGPPGRLTVGARWRTLDLQKPLRPR